MGSLNKMKDKYAGMGKVGFLDKISGKAVRNLLNAKKEYINSSPRREILKVNNNEQNMSYQNSIVKNQSYKKLNYSSSNPYYDESIEKSFQSNRNNGTKGESLYMMSDKERYKLIRKQEIKKSVKKEIASLESMFPIHLNSSKARKSSRNDSFSVIPMIKTEPDSRYGSKMFIDKETAGEQINKPQKVKLSDIHNENDNTSSISD